MKVSLPNPVIGQTYLTTDRAESSYGIPVLVKEDGIAYGPADIVRPADGLEWMHPMSGLPATELTAADIVRKFGLQEEKSYAESAEDYRLRVEMSRLFLGLEA
jgi:hypothetical protein